MKPIHNSTPRQLYRAGRELLNRQIDYRRRGGMVEGLTYATTYRCNSRCITCDIWKDAGDVSRELTLEDLKRTFGSSSLLAGLKYLNLTGGEPFLREDLVEIGRWFLDRYPGLELRIPTNGLMVPKTLRFMRELTAGQDLERIALGVSLDGMGETHDRIRGIPGNFKKCTELLRQCRSELPGLKLGIGVTITPLNLPEIEKLHDLAGELSVGFTARLAQESFYYQNDRSSDHRPPIPPWKPEELARAREVLHKIRDARFGGDEVFWKMVDASYVFLTEAVERTYAPRRTYTCFSGTYSFFLDPFGKVYPCIMLNRPVGDLKSHTFDQIWEGPQMQEVRGIIERKECNCWTECETIASIQRSLGFSLSAARSALEAKLRPARAPGP